MRGIVNAPIVSPMNTEMSGRQIHKIVSGCKLRPIIGTRIVHPYNPSVIELSFEPRRKLIADDLCSTSSI
jgi:hypothetical protein